VIAGQHQRDYFIAFQFDFAFAEQERNYFGKSKHVFGTVHKMYIVAKSFSKIGAQALYSEVFFFVLNISSKIGVFL